MIDIYSRWLTVAAALGVGLSAVASSSAFYGVNPARCPATLAAFAGVIPGACS